jgi:hypothetical protein
MDYDALFRAAVALSADQQRRLVFELSARLGIAMQRELSGEVRKRIQERAAAIDERGGPMLADQLADLGAPRSVRVAVES